MSFKLLDSATAIGASRAIRVGRDVVEHTVSADFLSDVDDTPISALTIELQGAMTPDYNERGVMSDPGLVVGTVAPEKLKLATFYYRINNVNYSLTGAEFTFSAAHVVSASKFGVILVFVDAAGNISTQVPLATQAYATIAAAKAAGDSLLETGYVSTLCYVGRIYVSADAGGWTANTDDLTDGSDLTFALFLEDKPGFYALDSHAFSAGEITAESAMWHVTAKGARWIRLYISAITGNGHVDGYYDPRQGAIDY